MRKWFGVSSCLVVTAVLAAAMFYLGAATQAGHAGSLNWWLLAFAAGGCAFAIGGVLLFGPSRGPAEPCALTRFDGPDGSRLIVRYSGSIQPDSAHVLLERAAAILGQPTRPLADSAQGGCRGRPGDGAR